MELVYQNPRAIPSSVSSFSADPLCMNQAKKRWHTLLTMHSDARKSFYIPLKAKSGDLR